VLGHRRATSHPPCPRVVSGRHYGKRPPPRLPTPRESSRRDTETGSFSGAPSSREMLCTAAGAITPAGFTVMGSPKNDCCL
jgi:hypothetical protein